MLLSRINARKDRGGQITVIFAAGMLTFLGMLSLTVDVGYYYATKAQLQAAADVALLTAYSQVQPYDSFEKQEQTLRQAVSQFEVANFGPSGVMGLPPSLTAKDPVHLFEVTVTMDPETKSLRQAALKTVYTVPTTFARVFGQESVDIGIYSSVVGSRVNRHGQDLMAGHLEE